TSTLPLILESTTCPPPYCLTPFFPLPLRHTPTSPLFPYTTLFRSRCQTCGCVWLRFVKTSRPIDCVSTSIAVSTGEGSSSKAARSEEHTSELQSPDHLVCRLLLEKKKIT